MDRPWLLSVLRNLRVKLGSNLALSHALGLASSNHVPGLLAERDEDAVVPNVKTCLMLAAAAGLHPSDVLRAAGHDDVIPVMERAYARRDLSRHNEPTPSVHAVSAASRETALAQLQDAARAIAGAVAALDGETPQARASAPARHRLHRTAG